MKNNKTKDTQVVTVLIQINEEKEEVYIVRSIRNYYLDFSKSDISFQDIKNRVSDDNDDFKTICIHADFIDGKNSLDSKNSYAIVHQLFSENELPSMESLVGMTNDYNGRHYVADTNTKFVLVNSFYSNEKQAFNTFMNLLNMLYPIADFGIEATKGNHHITSKKYATIFNKYYTYSEDKIGFLNQEMFDTDVKKANFVIGTFIRNGNPIIVDKRVEITFSNSLSHFKAVQDFVKALDWKIIKITDTKETFPQTQKIVFVPSDEYLTVFNKYHQK